MGVSEPVVYLQGLLVFLYILADPPEDFHILNLQWKALPEDLGVLFLEIQSLRLL